MKKRPDMLILIAVWQFLNAVGGLIGLIAIALFAYPQVASLNGIARTGGLFGLSIGAFFLVCFTILAAAGGFGLLNGTELGRVLSIVHAALNLIMIPIGTVIGILVIIYLGKPEVKEYFEAEPD
jgi:hypothetical protein